MRRLAAACTLVVALGLCTGCRLIVELVESDDDDPAAVDGGADTADADPDRVDADPQCDNWSYAPAHFAPCSISTPLDGLILGSGDWAYDTDTGALTDPQMNMTFPPSGLVVQNNGVELRLVTASYMEIQAGAILRATGARPLALVSWSDTIIDGTIDVSSAAGFPGAGADPVVCPDVAAQIGSNSSEGAGGGGGGGFGSMGGDGGTGDGGLTAAGTGGVAVQLPGDVRGGCTGGIGGNATPGPAGPGGGGLYLAARDSLTLDGTLHAGGGGGGGGDANRSGGSGGGSGGMLDVQAVTVTFGSSAILASNGGGGGGGCDNNTADPGEDALAEETAAPGGDGEGMGEPGGAGAFGGTDAEPGMPSNRGGGGGGGGVGFIVVRASTFDDSSAVTSPTATQQ